MPSNGTRTYKVFYETKGSLALPRARVQGIAQGIGVLLRPYCGSIGFDGFKSVRFLDAEPVTAEQIPRSREPYRLFFTAKNIMRKGVRVAGLRKPPRDGQSSYVLSHIPQENTPTNNAFAILAAGHEILHDFMASDVHCRTPRCLMSGRGEEFVQMRTNPTTFMRAGQLLCDSCVMTLVQNVVRGQG